MLRKNLLTGLLSCALLLPSLVVTELAGASTTRWRAVTHQMVGTSRYKETVVPFCDMVKTASGGRLVIEPYGAGVLFPVSETFDAVRDGMVQMAMIWGGFWSSKHPLFALSSGRPGGPLTSFSESYYRAERLTPTMEKLYAKFGVVYLGSFDFNPSEMLCSAKPIRSFSDFKGKNIRTGGLGGQFYNSIGASVVQLSPTEIYQALQLGTVDAAEYNDWLVNKEMALDEVTKFAIEPALHTDATDDKDLIVNEEAWKALPEDLKAIVIACRDMVRYRSAVAYGAGNERAKQAWLDKGVEIIHLPEADVAKMRQNAVVIINELAKKDDISAEYVREYAKVLYELGYETQAKELGFGK